MVKTTVTSRVSMLLITVGVLITPFIPDPGPPSGELWCSDGLVVGFCFGFGVVRGPGLHIVGVCPNGEIVSRAYRV